VPKTMVEDPKVIVSAGWLHERINDQLIKVIDTSWCMATMKRDPVAEHRLKQIPGAWFFDNEEICDKQSDLPHMAPPEDQFSSALNTSGIRKDHQLIVYDGMGLFSSPRVWWLFKLMGHDKVAVLDGGLPKWIDEGRPITDRERSALHIGRYGSQSPSGVDDKMFTEFTKHFDEVERLEILAVVSLFGFLNRWNSIAMTEIEPEPKNAFESLGAY